MKRSILVLATVAFAGVAGADYGVVNSGTWPKTWPAELEPLRKQTRTLEGPRELLLHYEIPFSKREEFEAAWPHLLKVKTKGAPIYLVRGPDRRLGNLPAGVRIHTPPREEGGTGTIPELPSAGPGRQPNWSKTNYVTLIVDGSIVDLNRIELPPDTPIIDQRFKDRPAGAEPRAK
jgi:hypothetical protein